MPDIVIERELSEKSLNLVDALQAVNFGQDVFDALCEVPSQNLVEILEMISHIIKHRLHDQTEH